jgi:hypothetical protein
MISHPYIVQSPVLFLVFNRPDTTRRVFQQIKAARPSRLYISADGPRPEKPSDLLLCREVRNIVSDIDWDCSIHTIFNDENRGCKLAVSSAIDWFFSQEEEGIILEDDCLPASSFFYFCDQLLEKYRSDNRIYSITGSNAQNGQTRGSASYYFSQLSNIWGWASWRRIWKLYDKDLHRYSEEFAISYLKNNFQDPLLTDYWLDIFKRLKRKEIDTWDQQFQLMTFFENGLCITPNVNLISNIGFGGDATHTFNPQDYSANKPTREISSITDPAEILPDREADYFLFNHEFRLDERRQKMEKDKLLRRRFKRWLRALFTKATA